MSEWKEVRIGEFCSITRGGSPRPIQNYITKDGTPWVKIADAKNDDRYIFSTKEFIKKEGEKKSRIVYPGDFILSNSATPGLPRFMKIRACIHDGWLLLRDIKGVDEVFLYYLLLIEREALLQQGNGSIFTNLKTDILKKHIVKLPPLPEQKAIAEVLSSLDDKIDLLHRQNRTLEQMAETLFREWFKPPDPLKGEGSGEDKEDWEEGILGDLINVKYGKDHKKLNNGDIPVFGSGGIMRHADKALYETESVLIPRKGTLSNIIYINEPFWTVDTMFYTEMKRPNLAKFIFHFVKGQDLTNMNVGSAVPSMTTQVLNNLPIRIPTNKTLENFENMLSPMYLKKKFNKDQILNLERMRNTLLPKLMNGKIKVN